MSGYQPTLLNILFVVISTTICAVVAIFSMQRRNTPGAATLSILMIEAIFYMVPRTIMASSFHLNDALTWFYISLVAANALPVSWLIFALKYNGYGKYYTVRNMVYLGTISAMITLLSLTDPLHHGMGTNFHLDMSGGFSFLVWDYGWLMWLYIVYTSSLLGIGVVLMIRGVIGRHRYYTWQSIGILVGTLAPVLGSILDYTRLTPYQMTAYSLAITGIMWGSTLHRFRFLEIGAITRNSILEKMTTGIVVLDTYNRILDINPAACRMLLVPEAEPVGRHFLSILPEKYALKPDEMVKDHFSCEIWIARGNEKICLELSLQMLYDTNGLMKAKLALLQDVTERKWAETRQEALFKISQLASTTRDLQEFYPAMHAIVNQLVPAPNLYIALYDSATEMISFPYHVDEKDNPPEPRKMVNGLTDHVIRTAQPLLISPDRRGLTRQAGVISYGTPAVDWLGVPLKSSDDLVFGVLAVQIYTDSYRYTERDKEVLTFVSTQIALAMKRKEAEEALRKSERLFRMLIENQGEGSGWLDQDENFLFANPTAEIIFGVPIGSLTGRNLREFLDDVQWQIITVETGKRKKGEKSTYELEISRPDDEKRSVLITATPQEDEEGHYIGAFGVFRDNTDLKQAQESLKFMSSHDALTGVHNRNFFEMELERMEKAGITPVSILMADVDDLKLTNDRLGHAAGDDLLRRAAQMLKSSFREKDVVARYGGDEFAILLPDIGSVGALELVQRVRYKMEQHNLLEPDKTISFSLGMATFDGSSSLVDALKRADAQMYLEKAGKKLFINQQNI